MIRAATSRDAQTLAEIHAESFGNASWNLDQMHGTLDLASTQGWVAEQDGKTIGFILCQIMTDQAEILTFCVKPDFRQQKIGEMLLQHARAALAAKSCANLFLEVAADNTAACNLYKKSGFQIIGKRVNYYKRSNGFADALTFELPLFASKA